MIVHMLLACANTLQSLYDAVSQLTKFRVPPAVMFAEWAADDVVFLRGPSDCGEATGGRPAVPVPPGGLLVGDALNGEGPLEPLSPALDSPNCCTLRQSELERLCFAGLHPTVAAVSAWHTAHCCTT